jgi:hypothetical protein
MKLAMIWLLTLNVPNGPGTLVLNTQPGEKFTPVTGWSCAYDEARRADGTENYRYVYCLNRKAHVGAELEVDACDMQTQNRTSRLVLLDFTTPDNVVGKSTGEVATINLGCVMVQEQK